MDATESGSKSTTSVLSPGAAVYAEQEETAGGSARDIDDDDNSDPRHRLTTSHSRSEIMLGLQTDEGQSAEVEIDTADQDDDEDDLLPEGLQTDKGQRTEVETDTAHHDDEDALLPEAEIPKGKVRKGSITDKVIKTKASEAIAAVMKEEAENRQRRFEKLLDEHAELVQEIQRSASSENLIPEERDQ
ncbi:hypothetical protein ACOMHN_034807 [Nucella lapillus]